MHLCVSCHLGGVKDNLGPITELSRGGGCNACHLQYSKQSLIEIKNRQKDNKANLFQGLLLAR